MVPPKTGCGWQTRAAIPGATAGGVHSTASRFPAGPCKKKFFDSCVELIGGQDSLHESCKPLRLDCSLRFFPYRDAKRFAARFHFDSGDLGFPFSIARPWSFTPSPERYQQLLSEGVLAIGHKFQFVTRDLQCHRIFMPWHAQWPHTNRQRNFISGSVLTLVRSNTAIPSGLGVCNILEVHGHIPARQFFLVCW